MDESEKGKQKKTPPSRPPQPRAMQVVKNLPSSVKKHFEQLSDLLPQRVRWFYYEEKKWAPFCGLDSLKIERCFRCLSTEANATLPDLYETCTVRGGLYDVDVVEKLCKPIYWTAEPLKICRGTWFKGAANENSWVPVDEDMARTIENSHQAIWRSMGISPGVSYQNKMHDDGGGTMTDIDSKTVLGELQLNGCSVEWNDLTEVWMHSDGMTSKILRGMVQKIGGSTGVQLHRGYHTESSETDCPAEVTHLVFVIHGIGQLMHNSINDCCHMLRCGSKQMAEKHFEQESKGGRVEFVPVEWRSSLKLDEGVIDLVTPHTVRGIRNVINTSMMDIMYYTSPFYREEIIVCVKNELNKLYQLFVSRNPSFKECGSVSIIAHSLGSVIVYDIMERWDLKLRDVESSSQNRFVTDSINYLHSMEECRSQSQSADSGSKENPIQVELAQTQQKLEELDFQLQQQMSASSDGQSSACVLDFKVANCFLLGSPLAVFFTLRGFRPGEETEKAVLPQIVCKKLFNVYDQCDPVAYRLEPLFRERYSTIEPVHIKSHAESSHTYDEAEQPLQPDSTGGTGNWLVYALLGRPQGGSASAENIEEGPPPNLDIPDAETAEAKGWFSRMFSRSVKKNTTDMEMDGKSDEECERNPTSKQAKGRVVYISYDVYAISWVVTLNKVLVGSKYSFLLENEMLLQAKYLTSLGDQREKNYYCPSENSKDFLFLMSIEEKAAYSFMIPRRYPRTNMEKSYLPTIFS